jgi:GNAT superfamily N-acetyltransferase
MSPFDVNALKELWQAVFLDSAQEIDRFFAHFYAPERTVALTDGGSLAAMAHLLPVGNLLLGEREHSCAMVYAVASDPALRGRGYGRCVTEQACLRAQALGYDAVVLHPASPPLFSFYESLGFTPFFSSCTVPLNRQSPATSGEVSLRRVPAKEYVQLRRAFLQGSVYIDFTPHALAYQEMLCGDAGGLFAAEQGGVPIGCAIIEGDGAGISVRELLCHKENFGTVSAALNRAFSSAKTIVVRAPEWAVPSGLGSSLPFGMLRSFTPLDIPRNAVKWYGPAFD